MNKPTKIRKVFEELRSALSEEFSDAMLLEGAAEIVEATYDAYFSEPEFSVDEGPCPFECMDTFSAIVDSPWKIMRSESEMMGHFFSDALDYVSSAPVMSYV